MDAMKAVRYGNPSEAGKGELDMGPLINEQAAQTVEAKVARAIEQGATLLMGGKRAKGKGYFFEPTVLVDGHHEKRNLWSCVADCYF